MPPGNLTALHMRISSQSILAYVFPQNLQNGMDPAVFQGLTPNSPEGHFGYTIPNLLAGASLRRRSMACRYIAAWHRSWGGRQLCGGVCGSVGICGGRVEGASHRRCNRPGTRCESAADRRSGRGLFRLWFVRALFGGCTVKDGRIEQQNFSTYPVFLMEHMPKVEAIVMPSGGFWGGVGEPTIAVAAPAVLNAIFAATGKRIRDLPLKNHDLRTA